MIKRTLVKNLEPFSRLVHKVTIVPMLRIVACMTGAAEVSGMHISCSRSYASLIHVPYMYQIIFYFSVTLEMPCVTASHVSSDLIGQPQSAYTRPMLG